MYVVLPEKQERRIFSSKIISLKSSCCQTGSHLKMSAYVSFIDQIIINDIVILIPSKVEVFLMSMTHKISCITFGMLLGREKVTKILNSNNIMYMQLT